MKLTLTEVDDKIEKLKVKVDIELSAINETLEEVKMVVNSLKSVIETLNVGTIVPSTVNSTQTTVVPESIRDIEFNLNVVKEKIRELDNNIRGHVEVYNQHIVTAHVRR